MEPRRSAPKPSGRGRSGINLCLRKVSRDWVPEPPPIFRLGQPVLRYLISRRGGWIFYPSTLDVTPSLWINYRLLDPPDIPQHPLFLFILLMLFPVHAPITQLCRFPPPSCTKHPLVAYSNSCNPPEVSIPFPAHLRSCIPKWFDTP